MKTVAAFLGFCICSSPLLAQQRVDSGNLYHRVFAVVPLVGLGTTDDPKRPMFAPLPSKTAGRSGVIAFQHVVSDDGTLALVEFVVANRGALSPILTSTAPGVIVFEAGKYTQAQIEAVFKKYKASFSFDNFRPLRVQ